MFYVYGFKENYYLYTKKYYGSTNFYQYNKELNAFSNISKFVTPYYHSLDEFNLIKDNLLNVSGYQIFTFYNSYNSLIDFYFQKENDSEYININSQMFKFNNLVKLLKGNKLYYLNFTVDHIIKLDNKFLDSEITFIDNNGEKYFLNKENKVLKNLTGDNITVISTHMALIYFYKRINESGIIELEFNKTQKGKLMKFNITNISNETISVSINIIRDFGFSGYYPMISSRSWDYIQGKDNEYTVYIENLYDKLINKEDIYEEDGEKLIVYIYPINTEKFEINNITYVDNLLTSNNKYNVEVIPANSKGLLIHNVRQLNIEYYQFAMCKSKEIKFNIKNSYGKIYLDNKVITKNQEVLIQQYISQEILIHSFESDNDFLFSYTFEKYTVNQFRENKILSVFVTQKNMLQIKFASVSDKLENYYILIAKKAEINNLESFSDICYVSKLFIKDDFNSILVKNVYSKHKNPYNSYIVSDLNITELKSDDNTDLVITAISLYNDYSGNIFKYYTPIAMNTNKKVKQIQFEEYFDFNVENNNSVFTFDYVHRFKGREQKLIILIKEAKKLDIYLTSNGNITRVVFHQIYTSSMLYESGKYYFELFKGYNSDIDINKGTCFLILTEILLDIIDLSKKSYSNKKAITFPFRLNPNYYIVTNLTQNKSFQFTFKDAEGIKAYDENPFIVCNNITNECTRNVSSYNFTEGNNYTIYISYLLYLDYKYSGFYLYPSFNIYSGEGEDDETDGNNNDGNDTKDDGLSTTTLSIIIVGSVVGFVIILVSIFLIIRHFKKKNQNIDFDEKTKEMSKVNLLE